MIDRTRKDLSVIKQCKLLSVHRSRMYYTSKKTIDNDGVIMNEIRTIYQEQPFYGYRKIHAILQEKGFVHNIKKTQRLMNLTGLKAIYPKKKTTIKNQHHKIYPYLLKKHCINNSNDAWSVDITYIKLRLGFVYLTCLIDIFSRKIMGWELSTFLETSFCLDALNKALLIAKPTIINSDQGSQFTSNAWVDALNKNNIQVSMDGKGRWVDNVYIERLWRSIKYESVFLQSFDTVQQAKEAISKYIVFYNQKRPHQSLNYQTPDAVYFKKLQSKHRKPITLFQHQQQNGGFMVS